MYGAALRIFLASTSIWLIFQVTIHLVCLIKVCAKQLIRLLKNPFVRYDQRTTVQLLFYVLFSFVSSIISSVTHQRYHSIALNPSSLWHRFEWRFCRIFIFVEMEINRCQCHDICQSTLYNVRLNWNRLFQTELVSLQLQTMCPWICQWRMMELSADGRICFLMTA